MKTASQRRIDEALAAAQARVIDRAGRLLAKPETVTDGRWWLELERALEGARLHKSLKLIAMWEVHIIGVLQNVEAVLDFGFSDGPDPSTDGKSPTDWRAAR